MGEIKRITLEEIYQAQDLVDDTRLNGTVLPEERQVLEKIAVRLRRLERKIIREDIKELIGSLKIDASELDELIIEMKDSAEELAKVANVVKEVTEVVQKLIALAAEVAKRI